MTRRVDYRYEIQHEAGTSGRNEWDENDNVLSRAQYNAFIRDSNKCQFYLTSPYRQLGRWRAR